MSDLLIRLVPAFSDNYIYLLVQGDRCAVVDPGNAAPVQSDIESQGLAISNILLTHHHSDHTGGWRELAQQHDCIVTGPDDRRVDGLEHRVEEGDAITVGNVSLNVFDVPGHTVPHIAFYAPDSGALFSGDSLFAGGCGRLFEGSPADMWRSLQKLAALPDDTRVYCGHEYTLNNLEFAASVDLDNAALLDRLAKVRAMRKRGEPTIPSTIEVEKETNPFLRCADESLRAFLKMEQADDVEVFAELRSRKDAW